jgi:hypothetical protein
LASKNCGFSTRKAICLSFVSEREEDERELGSLSA